ncbi:MAG: dUTP diphosphatase [Pleurocapsa sp. MO_226.B13]|nr:dUTP diphosphatase [Pleurocapsa sp. MO_226.B13]
MEIEIVKLNPAAIIPCYAHPGDAGLDLFSIEEASISPGETKLIETGIAIALPANTEAQIRPRSGLALKHSVTVLNSPGTIDAGYRGEIGVILINHGKKVFQVIPGMKIAQMVIASIILPKVTVVRELNRTSRGNKGFGSTGETKQQS